MKPGEFGYIDWIRERQREALASFADLVDVGPGDDCAVVRVPGESAESADNGDALLLTTDMMLEGAHFDLATATPEQVGAKLLAVNVSDIAAMGGLPMFALTSVGFAPGPGDELKQGLYRGLETAATRLGVALVGGDVTAWADPGQGLALSLALIGRTAGVPPVLRSGAAVGDVVFVTGELGGSLRSGRHLTFQPRVAPGRWLAEQRLATAMLDVSDGLASDLGHICDESRVGIRIDEAHVPLSPAAHEAAADDGRPALEHALGDGEDFELAFSVSAERADELERAWPFAPTVPLHRIGEILPESSGRVLRDEAGADRPFDAAGWDHLRA